MKPPCPCGPSAALADCCGRYHGGTPAPTPEALMRSRYSAFALGLEEYLLATWHPATRPASLDLHAGPQPKWIGLKILEHALQDDTHGTVRFVARYRVGGKAERLEEHSRFERLDDGRWYYLDGDIA